MEPDNLDIDAPVWIGSIRALLNRLASEYGAAILIVPNHKGQVAISTAHSETFVEHHGGIRETVGVLCRSAADIFEAMDEDPPKV